ncbi:MAG: GNAT family N-acetyltransferase [Bacteroidales bacterium]
MSHYKILTRQHFSNGDYSIVPIRLEDRYLIMQWRNEQMYHLRQSQPLTKETQDEYFQNVIAKLFDQDKPQQILFSYLQGNKCIGYGGLVHINWVDKNAEVSFIMETALEKDFFEFHWTTFLGLLEKAAFQSLGLHKIYTYAYDIRAHLNPVLINSGFVEDAVLKEHCLFEGKFIDVRIHSKINKSRLLRRAEYSDLDITYLWAVNPTVRKYSFNQNPITKEEHANWFKAKLNDAKCYYYILEVDNTIVGSIRFDLDQKNAALISYLIDPLYHGKGLGKEILELGVLQLLRDNSETKKVYGFVMEGNSISARIFEKLGYKKTITENRQLRFEKEMS